MNTVAIWIRTIGARATWPSALLMVFLAIASNKGWLSGMWLIAATVLVVLLIMTIPLAAIWLLSPGETSLEKRARERRQAKARADLLAHGLTPEQYLATLPRNDLIARSEAEARFGINS